MRPIASFLAWQEPTRNPLAVVKSAEEKWKVTTSSNQISPGSNAERFRITGERPQK